MLTTKEIIFAQPIYLPLESPPEIPVKRKRGGQPGNQNARLYQIWPPSFSSRAATSVTEAGYVHTAGQTFIDFDRQFRRQQRDSLAEEIQLFTDISWRLGDHFTNSLQTGQHRAFKLVFKAFISCANGIEAFADHSIRLTWQERILARCAENVHLARHRTNPNLCVFMPSFLQNPDTLSTFAGQPECRVSFLTDRHWHILEPLLAAQVAADQAATLRKRDPSKKQRASRLVPWPERFLLDGILWKLATACPWPKLPKPYPIRRCQNLYQSLVRSGRIGHIFKVLHEDLNAYGDLSLKGMALNGDYMAWGSRILYIPHGQHNWQGLVTLLLLQCARRALLRQQRNRPASFEYLIDHFCPDISVPADSQSDLYLLRKLIDPRKFTPPGLLRIPPPCTHPSIKHLTQLICHLAESPACPSRQFAPLHLAEDQSEICLRSQDFISPFYGKDPASNPNLRCMLFYCRQVWRECGGPQVPRAVSGNVPCSFASRKQVGIKVQGQAGMDVGAPDYLRNENSGKTMRSLNFNRLVK